MNAVRDKFDRLRLATSQNVKRVQSADSHAEVTPISRRSSVHETETYLLSYKQLEERRLIHYADSNREHVDAFREIRTKLLALGGTRNFVTLVVPISSGCGGSYVARNLAAAFAFDEAKTSLLIDCNLRDPAQNKAFSLEPKHGGLLDYLDRPSLGVDKINYRTGIPRLRLIPAGSGADHTREYLTSFRMRALIDSLRCRYSDRYLFLDGPAIKDSPDARILSELADYVVVVTGAGRDTPATINQALAAFDPDKLAGNVFNQLP